MNNPTLLAEALLGLDGFRILEVTQTQDELVINIETKSTIVGCPMCEVRAEAKDRMRVDIRDLPCFGRPARLVWMKRRWRCGDLDCSAKTWTETIEHVQTIASVVQRGDPFSEIARRMHRVKSTISREVKRNGSRENYLATRAQRDTLIRARRPKLRRLVINTQLATFVEAGLLKHWSPTEISARLSYDFSNNTEMRVSHETIYCYCSLSIYRDRGLIETVPISGI